MLEAIEGDSGVWVQLFPRAEVFPDLNGQAGRAHVPWSAWVSKWINRLMEVSPQHAGALCPRRPWVCWAPLLRAEAGFI